MDDFCFFPHGRLQAGDEWTMLSDWAVGSAILKLFFFFWIESKGKKNLCA